MVHPDFVVGFIGVAIGITVKQILYRVNIVLSYKKNLESLRDKVTSLGPIMRHMGQYHLETSDSHIGKRVVEAVKEWVEGLQKLHEEASKMKEECKIPMVNLISRYRTSKRITILISNLDKHLILVPLIELELLLWQRTEIEEEAVRKEQSEAPSPELQVGESMCGNAGISSVSHEVISVCIEFAVHEIISHIKIVLRFKEELKSLKDLVDSLRPIVDVIELIQSRRESLQSKRQSGKGISSDGSEHVAINGWIGHMNKLLKRGLKVGEKGEERGEGGRREKGPKISRWHVVSRYKMSKEIAELISLIDKQLKLVPVINSAINLEPHFQKKEIVQGSTRSSATTTVEQQMSMGMMIIKILMGVSEGGRKEDMQIFYEGGEDDLEMFIEGGDGEKKIATRKDKLQR